MAYLLFYFLLPWKSENAAVHRLMGIHRTSICFQRDLFVKLSVIRFSKCISVLTRKCDNDTSFVTRLLIKLFKTAHVRNKSLFYNFCSQKTRVKCCTCFIFVLNILVDSKIITTKLYKGKHLICRKIFLEIMFCYG